MSVDLRIEKFSYYEFDCNCSDKQCCGKHVNGVNYKYLDGTIFMLEYVRKVFQSLHKTQNVKIIITSGVRCPAHNEAVSGVPKSDHLDGSAADIQIYIKGRKLDDSVVLRTIKCYMAMMIDYIALTTNRGAVHISFRRDLL